MAAVELTGDNAVNLAKTILFNEKTGCFDLSTAKNWLIPIDFWPDTDVLAQTTNGPCGVFAALQTYINIEKSRSVDFEKYSALRNSAVRVLSRISPRYFLCTAFETTPETCRFTFQPFEGDAALGFLGDFFKRPDAALLFLISVVATSTGLDDIAAPTAQVLEEQWTSIRFQFLLLTGCQSESHIEAIKENWYEWPEQPEIGFRVVEHPEPSIVGSWLNPDAPFVVWYDLGHFMTVVGSNNDEEVTLYNCMIKQPGVVRRGVDWAPEYILRLR
jgi:hypothetical protein